MLEQCEQVSAHHGDRYQPLVWSFYSSHCKTLFRVIKTLDLSSTTSDQALIDAMNFLIAHEYDSKKYLETTLDLSFIPALVTDDLTFAIEPPEGPDVVEADQEALQETGHR